MRIVLTCALAAALAVMAACSDGRATGLSFSVPTGGVAYNGAQVIALKNCGSCHTIPGIQGAKGVVGPPLLFFGRRTFIAGQLPNTPENLVRWIRSPQSVEPDTAMPNLGLTDQQARDVAAYLYQLR
jgi:cytochrome c1